jgi:hypothetical protein
MVEESLYKAARMGKAFDLQELKFAVVELVWRFLA